MVCRWTTSLKIILPWVLFVFFIVFLYKAANKAVSITGPTVEQKNDVNLHFTHKWDVVKETPFSGISSNPLLPWYFSNGELRPEYNAEESLPVWPEDDDGDRILNQLMLTAPPAAPVKTIYLDPTRFDVTLGRSWFFDSKCPVNACEFTYSNINEADAVVFRERVKRTREDVPSKQIWIFFTLENPKNSGTVYPEGVVNWTATYRSDSDVVAPYGKWVYYDDKVRQILNQTHNFAAGKTKKVAWFVSNCSARNKRLEVAKELKKYIDVDIYGSCGDKKCPRRDGNCEQMLRDDYKFYLSFENHNCREYITEKFFGNALGNDILPVVMGGHPNHYLVAAPERSFIHVEDFPSVEALANYLHVLDKDDEQYNSYFWWKGTGEFINTRFFCRVCALLHNPRQGDYFYPRVNDWWQADQCRGGSWST